MKTHRRGLALLLPLMLNACPNPTPLVDKAVATVQDALDTLTQQSTQWQRTLDKLQHDLIAEGQSTLATEVAQLEQRGIATAGVELRCNADFIGHRMREGLERILAGLRKQPVPPVTPFFCQVSPTQIDLGVEPARRTELDFFGYNLDTGTVKVAVLDDGGEHAVLDNLVAMPTHYLMTINISESNGVHFAPTTHQMVFRLGAGGEVRSVNVVAAQPCGAAGQACCPHSQCNGGLCLADKCHVFAVGSDRVDVDAGGGQGGGEFGDECPSGAVATGFQGLAGAYIDQLQLGCAPLRGDGSLGAVSATPARGGGGGGSFSQFCRTGQSLVGLVGRSGIYIDQLSGQCSSPDFVAQLGGTSSRIGPFGSGGGAPYGGACPPRFVMTGITGRAGKYIDHLGFICRRLNS